MTPSITNCCHNGNSGCFPRLKDTAPTAGTAPDLPIPHIRLSHSTITSPLPSPPPGRPDQPALTAVSAVRPPLPALSEPAADASSCWRALSIRSRARRNASSTAPTPPAAPAPAPAPVRPAGRDAQLWLWCSADRRTVTSPVVSVRNPYRLSREPCRRRRGRPRGEVRSGVEWE